MLQINPMAENLSRFSSAHVDQEAREAQALQEFEKVFLLEMLKEMRNTVPESTLFGHSSQREHFEDMLDDVYAGQLAKSEQFGVAKAIRAQLEARKAFEPGKDSVTAAAMKAYGAGISLNKANPGLPMPVQDPGIALKLEKAEGIPLKKHEGIPLHPGNSGV